MKRIFFTFLLAFVMSTYAQAAESKLLRYPNASKTHITFCHGGDIYTVKMGDKIARRITSSKGIEMYPRFSPDGKTIAFTAEYDGNREIYKMPALGGEPTRLTYSMDYQGLPERMGPDKIIMQWTDNGENIFYRGRKNSINALVGHLFEINKDGGLPVELPLWRAGYASYSPDKSKLAFNQIFREYRTWKRYRGGQADDIWIIDLKTKKLRKITDNPAQDIIPMWHGDKIYFISDRDHTMNIFAFDLKADKLKKITNFKEYDVKYPSLGANHIAFQNGGEIYLMDLKTEKVEKQTIEVHEDFPDLRKQIVNVSKKIVSYEIAPDGKRALFNARGDIFTVPAKKGKIRNLTKSNGEHDRNAVWSPNGKWIAYISDKSGEDEVYIISPDGKKEKKLTDGAESYRFAITWSPDSKKILCADKAMKLYYIDIDSKGITQVAKSKEWEFTTYKWAPDSKYIAYVDGHFSSFPVIYLYSLESGKSTPITDSFFSSGSPEFSKDGKYLFFVSNRTFAPSVGAFEYNFSYKNMTSLYGLTLQDKTESPFSKFENDETVVKEDKVDKKKDKKDKKKKKDKKDKDLKIDFKNIKDRIFKFPVKTGRYAHLTSLGDKLYYNKFIRGKGAKLIAFDMETKKENEVGSFWGYEISNDGKSILFQKNRNYYISKLKAKIGIKTGKLNLSDMHVNLDRRVEWKQIFDEAWRQMKHFFYDPDMHGVNWKRVHKRYSDLLPYVVHRNDLTYIIGEMIAELNVGHAYVGGGEMPKVKSVKIGLLGAEFALDKSSGFYKITKILKGRNWEEKTRSPLTQPGIKVKEGDYLLEIDGEKLTKTNHPYKALVNKARKFVTLKVNTKPSDKGAKEYTVKTIASEHKLRYFNWVESNRLKVDKATNGRVGYIHIPDMGLNNGLNEFAKYYYPQANKEALIIDDRYNGGGNVSPMVIERLRRILVVAKHARNQEKVFTTPGAVMTGPMVCMINEQSMSDGDLFPYQFKQMKLGKIIGKRSWGGVIGIRGSLPFLDGSTLHKPEFANFGADGSWILEGKGMEPDIEIENHPHDEYMGIDNQLNKAIELIQEEMKTNNNKPKIPAVPKSYPNKK